MIWALNRIVFFFFAMMGILTAGVFCQILAPLYSWYFFNDLNFTRYYRYLFPVMGSFFHYFHRGSKIPGFFKNFVIPLRAPPAMIPDGKDLRLNPSWTGGPEGCNGCISCCVQLKCPMLDRKSKKCMSFGSFYWRYFNCGRFPVNQFQIDLYQCPKWVFSLRSKGH